MSAGSDPVGNNTTTDFPAELIRTLAKADPVDALTGAGVSQESGLHTFRDAPAGLLAQYKPEDLASPEAFARDPKLIWDWYAWRREAIKGARSNPGHCALAEMEKKIPTFMLITQNVVGLHRSDEPSLGSRFGAQSWNPLSVPRVRARSSSRSAHQVLSSLSRGW